MLQKQTIIKNEQGIASMVIVILIMTLLSLIVLSMTQNANREQKQSLDRQLNSQAFYAAESGVNDARDYYTKFANAAVDPAPDKKTKCDGSETNAPAGQQFPHGYSNTVGSSVNQYTCVLYDAYPNSLVFSDVSTSKSELMPIQDKTGAKIRQLTFSWARPNNANYNFTGCPVSGFPQSLTNCDAGALRIELINIDDLIIHDRAALVNADFLAFASPSRNAASAPASPDYANGVGTAKQGVSWRGGCTGGAAGGCTITINNIGQNKLLLHLRSFYNDNTVTITGKTTAGNNILFRNGQLMIDSTGRASDILKRIQVRVPLNDFGNGIYPEFALQTANGICKLQQIIPPGFPDAGSTEDPSCL